MRTVRRTAFVLPVASGWEDWFSYRDFFWNVVERIKEKTTSELSIRFGEKTFSSIQDCQRWAAAEGDEDIPGEIVFTGAAGVCCVLAFENWVDSGGVDPYSPSFTFSCYSANETIDEIVFKSCVSPLVTDCFGDYAFVRESDHFRWQWKAEDLWRVVKSWILPVLIALLVTLLYLYYSSPEIGRGQSPLAFQSEKCDNVHPLFLSVRDASVMGFMSSGMVIGTMPEGFCDFRDMEITTKTIQTR